MTTPPALTRLTEAQRAAAQRRFGLLRPTLEEGVPLARLARDQGIPLRTAQEWLVRYRRHGLAGLARTPRTDRGRRTLAPDFQRLIEGLALRTPPATAAFVHRQASAVAREHGWPVPSYGTVYAIIRHLEPSLVTLAHQGTKAYCEAFDMIHRREAQHPNEMWQADHSLLDIWLLDERGRPAKPWLSIVIDDYSRAIAGYGLSFQAPSALQTSLVLRRAIWRKGEAAWHVCGIPHLFYTDHGSDFTSRHLEQVGVDLKMQLVFSGKGAPRGRGKIERFFRSVDQLLLCQLPGFAPKTSGVGPETAQLTLVTLEERFQRWLVDDYHQRVHSEITMAPQARWETGGFLPRLPESLEELDLLLLLVATPRKVHPDGIHFQGFRYLDLTLAAYVGEAVTIRYDPTDLGEIRVFHNDSFLCRAISPELAGQTISLKDLVQARNQRRRQVRAQLDDRAAIVETLLAIHQPEPVPAPSATVPSDGPRLKRYINE